MAISSSVIPRAVCCRMTDRHHAETYLQVLVARDCREARGFQMDPWAACCARRLCRAAGYGSQAQAQAGLLCWYLVLCSLAGRSCRGCRPASAPALPSHSVAAHLPACHSSPRCSQCHAPHNEALTAEDPTPPANALPMIGPGQSSVSAGQCRPLLLHFLANVTLLSTAHGEC